MRSPVSPIPQGDPFIDVLATDVPLTRFTVSHVMWDFRVVVQNANGITVRDVMYALYIGATNRKWLFTSSRVYVLKLLLATQCGQLGGNFFFNGMSPTGSGRGDAWTFVPRRTL